MTTATTQLLTAEEFYDFCQRPENQDRHFELDRGKVVEVPLGGVRHGATCAIVAWLLSNAIRQQRKGYACSNNVGILWERRPDTVLGPDVIYFTEKSSLRELPHDWSEQVPALVVEVLSPTDDPAQVQDRAGRFLGWGVQLVWLVDPERHLVTLHQHHEPARTYTESEEILIEAFALVLRYRVRDFFLLPGEDAVPPSS